VLFKTCVFKTSVYSQSATSGICNLLANQRQAFLAFLFSTLFLKLVFLANQRQAGFFTSKPISDKRFWPFYLYFVFKTFVFSQSATSGIFYL
jgi:hypothetical protein